MLVHDAATVDVAILAAQIILGSTLAILLLIGVVSLFLPKQPSPDEAPSEDPYP